MSELSRTRKHVEAAWHAFVADGALPDSIRPEILRSWRRARAELRVDPGLRACPTALPADEALARAEAEHRAAARLVTHFAGRLAADGHVVAYFDDEGVMLALEGNRRTRSRLFDVNFVPGACWSERLAGTNGVGTALAEGRPLEVFAAEHFVEAWQPWTCASAPVRVGGRIAGVVDITSPWSARTPSLLYTAEAMAQAIASEFEADAARQQGARMAQVAREALRARDDLLTVASHELKTPLTPLQLKLQQVQRLLARDGEGVDLDALVHAFRGADRHLGRLVRFLDELVEVARVAREPLRLAPAPTGLVATVRAAIERRRADLERHGCRVLLDAPGEVMGRWDAARVGQAFEQLLGNAIRYAPGPIEVTVRGDGATARLSIRDHGPGIAREDQARIFLPFERAVSSRHASGFGLGLHAVQRIAEAHGGAVHLESAPGAGSTFVLELPVEAAEEGAAASSAPH